MKYRPYSTDQLMLLPPAISDMIASDSPLWLIMETVNSNLVEGLETSKSEEGNAAYNPLMMTRLLVYAYYNKIHASREIARRAYTDIEFMYLTGLQHPNFRTICNFRKSNEDFLARLYKKIYRAALELKLTRLGLISIDGTVMKGNVSGKKGVRKISRWKEIEREVEREIREYHERSREIDAAEDAQLGANESGGLPKELQKKERRLEKIRQAISKMESENVPEDVRINPADSDARFIKKSNVGGHTMGYNAGLAVDENQLIAHVELSNVSSDVDLFEDCVEGVEETLGGEIPEGTKVLGDKGCSGIKNIKLLEEKKLDGYLNQTSEFKTVKNKGSKKRRHDCPINLNQDYYIKILGGDKKSLKSVSFAHMFSIFPAFPINYFRTLLELNGKLRFVYDEDSDCFICPMGRQLVRHSSYKRNKKCGNYTRTFIEVKFKSKLPCTDCPLKGKCTHRTSHKYLNRDDGFEALERMRRKMDKEESRDVYKKRRSISEPVNASIKQHFGLREFNIKGFAGKVELGITALCHNIKRIGAMLKAEGLRWSYELAAKKQSALASISGPTAGLRLSHVLAT